MPDIRFNCYRCSQSLVVDAAGIGLTVSCPTCGISLEIPPKSSPRTIAPEAPVTYMMMPEAKAPAATASSTAITQKPTAPEVNTQGLFVLNPTVPETTTPKAKPPETVSSKAATSEAAGLKGAVPEAKVPDVKTSTAAVPKATAPNAKAPEAPVPKTTVPADSRPKDGTVSVQKLIGLLLLAAKDLECEIDGDAAALIARSAKGNPEEARKRLRCVLAYGRSGTVAPVITLEVAAEGLKAFERENRKLLPRKGKF